MALTVCMKSLMQTVMQQDLNVLQANAWVYWQAIENSEVGNFWGLIQARHPVISYDCTRTTGDFE